MRKRMGTQVDEQNHRAAAMVEERACTYERSPLFWGKVGQDKLEAHTHAEQHPRTVACLCFPYHPLRLLPVLLPSASLSPPLYVPILYLSPSPRRCSFIPSVMSAPVSSSNP